MHFTNEQQFLDYLLEEIEKDRIVLPSLPEVALKVRDAVDKGDANASQLANMISEDAALTARLLQVANSPLYRARTEISNLQMAVMRLGYNTVRTLMMGLAMKQVFQPDSALLGNYFHDVWQASVDVAAISRAMATLSSHLDTEQALLAGLIHQIGKLPILSLADKSNGIAKDQQTLDHLLESLHPNIGEIIMEKWNFPTSLSRVVREYKLWDRQPESDEADYVDVVQVAYLEHLTGQGKEPPAEPSQIAAFPRLGLAPDIEVVEIKGIDETRQLFS